MELKNLNTFLEIAKNKSKKKIAVAAAEDTQVLEAISKAMELGIADTVFVGNKKEIVRKASEINFNLKKIEIINEENPAAACKICVQLVKQNNAQIIMKGLVKTVDYLRAILDKDSGLRKSELLSHIGFFELANYHKLLALTDAAQNIAPTLDEKVSIIKNSVDLFHRLGVNEPKIAVVGAIENINLKMEPTVHAALLTMMNKRNQITGCKIDGPLAFDNAISKDACEHKGVITDVGGDADLLLMPNIECGNILYKSLTYFGGATVAAIMIGANVPIVLTSRADSDKSKLMSIALAASF